MQWNLASEERGPVGTLSGWDENDIGGSMVEYTIKYIWCGVSVTDWFTGNELRERLPVGRNRMI